MIEQGKTVVHFLNIGIFEKKKGGISTVEARLSKKSGIRNFVLILSNHNFPLKKLANQMFLNIR